MEVVISMLWRYLNMCWALPVSPTLNHTYTLLWTVNGKSFFFISFKNKHSHMYVWVNIHTQNHTNTHFYLELFSNLFFLCCSMLLSDPVMAQLCFLWPPQQNALMVVFILEIWGAILALRSIAMCRTWSEFKVAQVQTRQKGVGVLEQQGLSFECVVFIFKNLVSLLKRQFLEIRLSLQLDLSY